MESGIKYVKNNFFAGRRFDGGRDCDSRLRTWMEAANRRLHGTTRKVPAEVFHKEEKEKLLSLPLTRYQMPRVGSRRVYHDCHIFVEYNYYSVPFEYAGKDVDIELTESLLRVYYSGEQIALHSRIEGQGEFSTDSSHYPKYKQYSETEQQERYQLRMAEIGVFAEQMFFLILKENKGYWSQPVSGILSLTKKYPMDVVNLACKRAVAYGAHQYQVVKKICESGAYILPLEFGSREEVQ